MNKYKEITKSKRLEAGKLMNEKQLGKCNITIHIAAVINGVFGFIPLPIADAIPICIIQLLMILVIGKVLKQRITSSAMKGFVSIFAATFIGRALVQVIPLVGWIVSASIAFGITEAIGWLSAAEMGDSYRKEWLRQNSEHEAAKAYADAEYYKQIYERDNLEAVDDFSNL